MSSACCACAGLTAAVGGAPCASCDLAGTVTSKKTSAINMDRNMNFNINFGLILDLSAAEPHRCRRPLIFNEAAAIVCRPGSAQGGKPACELPAKPAKGLRGL